MPGVAILAMEEVATEFGFNIKAAFICLGISILLASLIGGIKSILEQDIDFLLITLCVGVFFGFITGTIVGWRKSEGTTYENQFKVTISDEVSLNEFLDKYEIIDQEGKIYTVREK